jgi:hypothetical protein
MISMEEQSLSDHQLHVLRVMRRHDAWYPACGWVFGTMDETIEIMQDLAERGLVDDLSEPHAPRFEINDRGRAVSA